MRNLRSHDSAGALFFAVAAAWIAGSSTALAKGAPAEAQSVTDACPQNDSGLTLPPGFCASVFADGIGHARHLVVAPNGVVYVNTWSGRYYGNDTPPVEEVSLSRFSAGRMVRIVSHPRSLFSTQVERPLVLPFGLLGALFHA